MDHWEIILTFCSALVRNISKAVSRSGVLSKKETWTYQKGFTQRTRRWLRAWNICHMWSGWESWDYSAGEEKAQRDLINAFELFMRKRKKDGARLFSMVSNDEIEGRGHKLKNGKFHLNVRKIFFRFFLKRFRREVVESLNMKKFKTRSDTTLNKLQCVTAWKKVIRLWSPEVLAKLSHSAAYQTEQGWCTAIKSVPIYFFLPKSESFLWKIQ